MKFSDLPALPRSDFYAIIDYYITEAGDEVALTFIDALERAMRQITDHPDAGSPRLASVVSLKGLRVWPIKGFQHLILYRSKAGAVTIARVLHSSRDIPHILRELE